MLIEVRKSPTGGNADDISCHDSTGHKLRNDATIAEEGRPNKNGVSKCKCSGIQRKAIGIRSAVRGNIVRRPWSFIRCRSLACSLGGMGEGVDGEAVQCLRMYGVLCPMTDLIGPFLATKNVAPPRYHT
jgi:hypothetical protein